MIDIIDRRFAALLQQLSTFQPYATSILDLGCGALPDAACYAAQWPGARLLAVDWDLAALQRIEPSTVGLRLQADGLHLPFAGAVEVVVARHPDVDRHREGWRRIFAEVARILTGTVLVTTYTATECDLVRRWMLEASLSPVLVDPTVPLSLSGRDRFALRGCSLA